MCKISSLVFYSNILFLTLLLSACSETTNAKSVETEVQTQSSKLPSTVAMKKLAKGIYASADDVKPLLIGQSTQSFKVKTVEGSDFTYNPKTHNKPIVLTFFRGGWCPYCNLHLSEMRKAEEELKTMGFDVWFISIDKPELLYESLKNPDVGYTIYSDAELEATKAFGIGFEVDAETIKKYEGFGISRLFSTS